jgi:hypothetical protein
LGLTLEALAARARGEPEDVDDAEHMFRLWALCVQRANRRRAEASRAAQDISNTVN